MAATIRDVVNAMRLMNGETEAVLVIEGVATLYEQAIKDRDDARASEAAAKAALETARADAAATAARLTAVFLDLQDGVYDGQLPTPADPAPAEPLPAQ